MKQYETEIISKNERHHVSTDSYFFYQIIHVRPLCDDIQIGQVDNKLLWTTFANLATSHEKPRSITST